MDSPCTVFFWSVNMSELSQTCNMSFKLIVVVQIWVKHGKVKWTELLVLTPPTAVV